MASELLKNGWAKLKEIKREASDEDNKKKDLEIEAKNAGKGIWNPHGQKVVAYVVATTLFSTLITGAYGQSFNACRLSGICDGMER